MAGPAGLVEFGVEFFGVCGLYGDPRKPYGEMARLWGIWCGVWENGRPMGICHDVWGDASGVWPYGKTAIPYGETACVWEATEWHGGRRTAWGACPNGRLGAICGLCVFLQQPGAPPRYGRRRTGRRCYLYTVQSSGVFIVFIPEKTQKFRRLNRVIQAMR